MSTENDGGPAFPTTPVLHVYQPDTSGVGTGCGPGMSLRDWFAGQALAGCTALQDGRFHDAKKHPSLEEWRAATRMEDAVWCYAMADAMLKAREASND